MFSAIKGIATAIAPSAIAYGKELITQYLSQQLGDLSQKAPRVMGMAQDIVIDTLGNNRDLQTRMSKLQQACRSKGYVKPMSSRYRSRTVQPRLRQDTEMSPRPSQKRFYEAQDEDYE